MEIYFIYAFMREYRRTTSRKNTLYEKEFIQSHYLFLITIFILYHCCVFVTLLIFSIDIKKIVFVFIIVIVFIIFLYI